MFREFDNCVPGGAEQYDVLWLHNEKEIKPSKDFEYKSSGQTHSLIIQEIFPEDAGSYTCEAFNDVGECFSTCSLVVEVPGEEVWLLLSLNRCHSTSFRASVFIWPMYILLSWVWQTLHWRPQWKSHQLI